jgi:DNA-binding GntR family transcriptional regulator
MDTELSGAGIRRRPGLADQVYDALTSSIAAGKLRPGEHLIFDRLAEQLGVSATPVREALARLIPEGIVQEGPHGKLYLIPITRRYVADIFRVRASLEGLAAELAAERLDEAALAAIRAELSVTAAALDRGDMSFHFAVDARLHRLIREAADNAVLQRELESIQLHTDYIRGFSQRHSGDHIRFSHQEHLELVAALARHDAAGARATIEQHIRAASERIANLIDFDHTD